MTSYKDAPTRIASAGGVDFAYRELGPKAGIPVIFLVHLAGNLDNWDPRVVDGIAAKHRVITFDNRGVGASTGKTPETIKAMAKDAAERYDSADPVNIGTGEEVRIRDLAELIARLSGFSGETEWDSSRPDGQPRRCLDVTRARERMGFEAEVPLEEGLRRAIQSFRES